MAQTIDQVFRDFKTQGVPASGDHKPVKPEIRALLKMIQNSGGLSVTRNTLTALQGVTPPTENYMGVVLNDADPTKNGFYSRVSGAWVKGRPFPDTVAALTVTGGTANDVRASARQGVDPSEVLLYLIQPAQTNSGAVTLSIGGAAAKPVLDVNGAALTPGLWTAGRLIQLVDNGSAYRLVSDPDADGAATSAAASALAAQQAASDAQGGVGRPFATKALAEAYNPVTAPDFIQLVGYAAAGDLGAIHTYKKVGSEPSHLGKIHSADGTWWELTGLTVSLAAFGPTRDGVTDDTAVLNSAISYASGVKGKLIIPAGDYSIHNGVLKSNVHIEFMAGARLIQPDSVSVDNSQPNVLYGLGTTGAAVAVTTDVALGDLTVTVAGGDSAGFSAGSYALIYDDDYVFPAFTAGRNQELVRVISTSSTTITFSKGLTTALTTANNVKIAPLDPIQNLTISGPGEIIVGLNRAAGVRIGRGVNCLIVNGPTVRRSRGGGSFVFDTCFDSHMDKVSAFDGQSPTTGGTGYGVSLNESSTFCSVTNSHFENLRENTYTNRTRWSLFANNICVNFADSGWNTHGAGSDHNVCQGNTFKKCSQGVAVGWSGSTRADNDNVVQNNTLVDCTNGISVSGNSTGAITGLRNVVKENVIRGATARAISIFYQNGFSVSANEVLDSATTGATGIYVVSTCDNGSVCHNTVRNYSGDSCVALRSAASSNIMVSHNLAQTISGASALAFYVSNDNTDVRVQLNAAMDHTNVNLAGAAVNTLNTWN